MEVYTFSQEISNQKPVSQYLHNTLELMVSIVQTQNKEKVAPKFSKLFISGNFLLTDRLNSLDSKR